MAPPRWGPAVALARTLLLAAAGARAALRGQPRAGRPGAPVAGPAARAAAGAKLLLFWAVGDRPQVQELVRKNVAHIRATAPGCCSVALHHYTQHGRTRWYLAAPKWYEREVWHTSEGPGFKFEILRELFTRGGGRRNATSPHGGWMTSHQY